MSPRDPTPRGAERSILGPAWKSEARGVWKRDYRRGNTAPSGANGAPTVLRIRESRNGFIWELWRGQQMTQNGEAKTADEAADHAEYAAGASATPSGIKRSKTPSSRRTDDPPPVRDYAPPAFFRPAILILVALSWFAQLTALWRGVANPYLMAVSLVASLVLAWMIVIRRMV